MTLTRLWVVVIVIVGVAMVLLPSSLHLIPLALIGLRQRYHHHYHYYYYYYYYYHHHHHHHHHHHNNIKNNNPKTKFTVSARSGNNDVNISVIINIINITIIAGDGSNNDKDDLKKHDTIVYNNTDDELNTIGNNFDSDDDVDHDNDNVFSSSFGSTGMSEKRKENSSNYCNNNNNNNTNTTNDENSLDNLIEMLKNTTPQQSPVSKPTFNVTRYQHHSSTVLTLISIGTHNEQSYLEY